MIKKSVHHFGLAQRKWPSSKAGHCTVS